MGLGRLQHLVILEDVELHSYRTIVQLESRTVTNSTHNIVFLDNKLITKLLTITIQSFFFFKRASKVLEKLVRLMWRDIELSH